MIRATAQGCRGLVVVLCATVVLMIPGLASSDERVYCVRFSPDGKQVIAGGASRKIQLLDVQTGREIISFEHPGWLHTAVISPDGKQCLSGTRNRTMRLWDLATGKMLREFNHRAWLQCGLFLPDGKSCISIGGDDVGKGDAAIRVWDPESGRELRKFNVPISKGGKWGNWLLWGSLSGDGKLLATAGVDLIIWNVATGEPVRALTGHNDFLWEVALSADGKTCAAGGSEKTVFVWRVSDGRRLGAFKQPSEVRAVAISPDGKNLVAGGLDGKIAFLNLQTGRRTRAINAHKWIVESLDFSPDGKMLVSGSFDGTVKLWSMKTGKLIQSF